jgi:hypothetical protein
VPNDKSVTTSTSRGYFAHHPDTNVVKVVSEKVEYGRLSSKTKAGLGQNQRNGSGAGCDDRWICQTLERDGAKCITAFLKALKLKELCDP